MSNEQQRFDRVVSNLTRRKAIAGTGALLTAGGTLVWVADDASASVTIGEFSVSDASFTKETIDPVLTVTIGYDYDVGTAPVQDLAFGLSVDGTEIASDKLSTSVSTHTGELELSGSILDSDAWSASDFEPAVASTVEQTVNATIDFAVLESDGSEIAGDSATDSAVVSISHPQETEYVASIGGVGSITDGY